MTRTGSRRTPITVGAGLLVCAVVPIVLLLAGTRSAVPRAPVPSAGAAPVVHTASFGVVSFNLRAPREQTVAGRARMRADVRRLARTPAVDVIGFQEAPADLAELRTELSREGWAIYAPRGIELPIAWRASRFSLATDEAKPASVWWMSAPSTTSSDHFPARFLTRVVLRHSPSGRTVAVFNTHVNQRIERRGIPRHNQNWTRADRHLARLGSRVSQSHADVTVLTGDLNVDAGYDAQVRRPHLPYTRFATLMQSSYRLLGIPHDYTGLQEDPLRAGRIDYVFLKVGNTVGARMTSQRVLTSYRGGPNASDHAPLLVRFSLVVKRPQADLRPGAASPTGPAG